MNLPDFDISVVFTFLAEHWDLAIIPFVAAIVGWGTNILAIRMTFKPLEFFGLAIKPFFIPIGWKAPDIRIGWQGIVPAKAGVITGKTVDLLTEKLISVEEQFEKIDPKIVADEMEPTINRLSRTIIDDIMKEEIPLIWRVMSERRKKVIFDQAAEEFPKVVEEIMLDVKKNITSLFDLRGMAVEALTSNKELLNELFLRCGKEEFKFIERSGFYFGFLFGLIQMVIWYFNPMWWILPLGGLFVGYATNWLALKMIFHPTRPIRFFFWKIQGLFIKRQHEVAKEYAILVSENILNSPKIFDTIINGQGSERMVQIVKDHVEEGVDHTAGLNRSLIQLSSGTKRYDAIRASAVKRFLEVLPTSIQDTFDYADEALDIRNTLREKLSSLSPKEFVGVLRPAFQEDEWKLILTGCALGGIAGLLQLTWFLAQHIQII